MQNLQQGGTGTTIAVWDLQETPRTETGAASLQPGIPVALEPGVFVTVKIPVRAKSGQNSSYFNTRPAQTIIDNSNLSS